MTVLLVLATIFERVSFGMVPITKTRGLRPRIE